ncbi:unnamed protein product [Gongylonema pulchrum]|uniref:Uncharacterized protein n=1 Tax=Gongylonema pulchrum TaxID=637853 RepID=A0A3P7P9W8_9BILA|nr:unnamed protein product [Gongylonema pulchrum]
MGHFFGPISQRAGSEVASISSSGSIEGKERRGIRERPASVATSDVAPFGAAATSIYWNERGKAAQQAQKKVVVFFGGSIREFVRSTCSQVLIEQRAGSEVASISSSGSIEGKERRGIRERPASVATSDVASFGAAATSIHWNERGKAAQQAQKKVVIFFGGSIREFVRSTSSQVLIEVFEDICSINPAK